MNKLVTIDTPSTQVDYTNPVCYREWYYEESTNSDILTITVGDSWTWGDSLGKTTLTHDDYTYRTQHIYGNILSKKLASDFINIGLPGRDNITIIATAKKIITNLTKSYKKIYLVFTLTETGRELNPTFLDLRENYIELKGNDWPEFEEIVNGTASKSALNFALTELKNNDIHFRHHLELYLQIKNATSVLHLLQMEEAMTFNFLTDCCFELRHLNIDWIVGRNFTSTFETNNSLLTGFININKRWVDIIADNGQLAAYPNNLYIMSQIGLNPLLNFIQVLNIDNVKSQLTDVIEKSLEGVNWLDNSPYNSRSATKHPLEQAHQWWADHIYNTIQ